MNIFATPALIIITFLGRNHRKSYYVREVAKILSISTGAASEQLRALETAGLVTSEQKGRTLLFRAAIAHPLVREAKIFSTLAELSPLIAEGRNDMLRMILFGSCTTGEDTEESDIDLYIETIDRPAVSGLIDRYGPGISRTLSPIIVTPDEGRGLRARDPLLFDRIRAGRILVGDPL